VDLREQRTSGYISSKFHNSIVTMSVNTCCVLRERWKITKVALSGGCFQNTYFLCKSITKLKDSGFEVFVHHQVPPNDGGIALGQALIANELLKHQ